jgi:hypothetical protein
MAHCVGGKVPWNVEAKPIVFLIWHAKVEVNLTQVKVDILTRVGFHLVALRATFSSIPTRGALPPNCVGHFVTGAHPIKQNGILVC